jgi:hypothetical protein
MTSRARFLLFGATLALGLGCRPSAATQASGEAAGEQPEPATPEPEPIPMCDGQACESPRQCVSYYGIAGPAGPLFHSCEIRCDRSHEDGACPEGMRCVTIADGPGDVCQAE